eukprot:368075_1
MSTEKLNSSQYEQDATPSEGYSVGPLNDSEEVNNSLSPSPRILLNRSFSDNPFADRSSRYKFISSKHNSILKQFSSSHFHMPSAHNINNETSKITGVNING